MGNSESKKKKTPTAEAQGNPKGNEVGNEPKPSAAEELVQKQPTSKPANAPQASAVKTEPKTVQIVNAISPAPGLIGPVAVAEDALKAEVTTMTYDTFVAIANDWLGTVFDFDADHKWNNDILRCIYAFVCDFDGILCSHFYRYDSDASDYEMLDLAAWAIHSNGTLFLYSDGGDNGGHGNLGAVNRILTASDVKRTLPAKEMEKLKALLLEFQVGYVQTSSARTWDEYTVFTNYGARMATHNSAEVFEYDTDGFGDEDVENVKQLMALVNEMVGETHNYGEHMRTGQMISVERKNATKGWYVSSVENGYVSLEKNYKS